VALLGKRVGSRRSSSERFPLDLRAEKNQFRQTGKPGRSVLLAICFGSEAGQPAGLRRLLDHPENLLFKHPLRADWGDLRTRRSPAEPLDRSWLRPIPKWRARSRFLDTGERDEDAHSVSFHSLGMKKNNALRWKEITLLEAAGTKRARRPGGSRIHGKRSRNMK